jgi:hypothetical protein
MKLTLAHSKILHRLAETTRPITPTEEERPLFEELYENTYLSYVYQAHEDGYIIGPKGRDAVTVHRQRNL